MSKNATKNVAAGQIKNLLNIDQIKEALKSGNLGDLTSNFTPKSAVVQKRINALKNEQLKFTELEAKFFEEMHALECKYQAMYEPIFERRRQIVSGEYEPNETVNKGSHFFNLDLIQKF
jgi:hypothetical protein